MNNRNMFMGNHNNYHWNQGHGHHEWHGFGNPGIYMNQGHFPPGPPAVPFQNRMNNYNNFMVQGYLGPNWQGPGPSRPRGRGHRRWTGPRHHSAARRIETTDNNKDTCCQCGEQLQNSGEPGIHLCSGSNNTDVVVEKTPSEVGETSDPKEDDLDERLEKLLDNLKDCLRKKYQTVTEALEEYVTGKIGEITSLHRENLEQKESLQKLKTELEEKAASLLKEEKELRDKQKRLAKDQENFKKEMKKEKEEVCRKWQELKDEITRMEETHEIQKGRIKLDVGGNIFTTSILTLTRESDSMLAAMFSGRHEIISEPDGCVFIDRDGTHFRHVLNYLRDGGVHMDSLPRNRQFLKELRKEAVYYQLHGLIQQIEKYLY